MSQANSQVPPSFWRVFEESPTQRAIQQVAEAMRQHQSRVISQTAQAMIPDLRIMVARSQPRGIAAVAEMLGKINTGSQLDRLMAVFNAARNCELVRRSGRRR